MNQQFWRWWSGDLQGGNKMKYKERCWLDIIRKHIRRGITANEHKQRPSFVKVVPQKLRLLNSGMMTESWIWSWFAFHPEALVMPIIDLSRANEIHVTLQWTILTAVNLVQPSFKSCSLQTVRWTNICKPHTTTNFIEFEQIRLTNKSVWSKHYIQSTWAMALFIKWFDLDVQ